MKIKKIAVGELSANCYIVYDEKSLEGVMIDPGDDGVVIMEFINKEVIQLKYILNTHGHFDHVGDNEYIKKLTGAEVLISEKDEVFLTNPENLGDFYKGIAKKPKADRYIKQGDEIVFGDCKLTVLETPGHSKGGLSFYNVDEKVIFTGDTLFRGSIGRYDFFGGSLEEIIKSIKGRMAFLADDVVVYPGHGASTTMGYERGMNRYLK